MQDTHGTHPPAWDRLRSLVLAPAPPSPAELPYEREQQVGAGIARKSDWCRVLRLEVVRSNDTSNIEAEVDGRARTPGSRQTHYSIMKLCAFARAVQQVRRNCARDLRHHPGVPPGGPDHQADRRRLRPQARAVAPRRIFYLAIGARRGASSVMRRTWTWSRGVQRIAQAAAARCGASCGRRRRATATSAACAAARSRRLHPRAAAQPAARAAAVRPRPVMVGVGG